MWYTTKARFTGLTLFVLGVFLLVFRPANAQTQASVYWRYDAPGRLNHVSVVDIDQDNIDEFIVVANDVNLVLVGADGSARWPAPYISQEPIRQIAAVAIEGHDPTSDEIVLGTDSHLILVNSDGEELWQRPLKDVPVSLKRFSRSLGEQNEDIMVALQNGALLRFNGQGQIEWEYEFDDSPAKQAMPRLEVADLNQDGLDEIIYSYLSDAGFSNLILLDAEGNRRWERSNSGNITAMSVVEFEPGEPLEIALATTLNRVYLYTDLGDRRWPFRSPNRPITSLSMAESVDGPVLVVGTDAGTIIAYDRQGRRIWSDAYGRSAEQPVLSISAPLASSGDIDTLALSVLLGNESNSEDSADLLLLDGGGRKLEPTFEAVDIAGLSQLIDINRDGKKELLLAGFATLELLDPGIGERQFFEAWDYRLGAEPTSVIIEDIDLNGVQEIIIGTQDGKLHALRDDGTVLWVTELGDVINNLATAKIGIDLLPHIIATHNSMPTEDGMVEDAVGWIEVLRPDGRPLWSISMPTNITSILVGDINRSGLPELIVGTSDGQVIAYSLAGDEHWRADISSSIEDFLLINDTRGIELIVRSDDNTISRLNNKGTVSSVLATYKEDIVSLDQIAADERPISMLLVGLQDGTLYSLGTRGNQNWLRVLDGVPISTFAVNDSLFVGTDIGNLLKVGSGGNTLWELPGVGQISNIYWGDLDGDVRPDIAAGNRAGEVRLLNDDGTSTWDLLKLASEVVHVSAVRQTPDLVAELVAITDNGIVQLFNSQANRPPLLINPKTDVEQGKYSISVDIIDVENDPVLVTLDIYDSRSEEWTNVGEKRADNGNDTLFWPISLPEEASEIRYRFNYDDGTHRGVVEPSAGPPPILGNSIVPNLVFGLLLVVVGTSSVVIYVRQSRSPSARVRRFFQRVRQQPELTLYQLDVEYSRTGGSPDFLLNLANRARQERDEVLASLADGLYLLNAQPDSALPIINKALTEAVTMEPKWRYLDEWKQTYWTGQTLIRAPTITELTLLLPQLQELINTRKAEQRRSEAVDALLPILVSLNDGERVDYVDDRLVYFNEAAGLLRQLKYQSNFWPLQIENVLAEAIVNRWTGLVKAEIEELHGRAQLLATLLTKRLVPEDKTIVALAIKNVGRSAAERLTLKLEESPSYDIISQPQFIPILSPGRERQVQFTIQPKVVDRFRIVFDVRYDDRHGLDKSMAFADMVSLLPPVHQFSPIVNPYSPGMPLRPQSSVFFGRDELFNFIKQNGSNLTQQNVLILIGQRRTGKTSALLQLDNHLPITMVPVFIDCQSLGVTAGMPALFHDLAWNISDALLSRGYELAVPDLNYWQIDPTGRFQRQFLAKARELLPKDTSIVLIFDEFEAFENLVQDEILPSTLFTYFRHLMQHGERLNFIFAGTHRLEEMSSDYWSVLFNSALYHRITFLRNRSAIHLIRDPVEPHIIYDDLAIDKILRVTAGHPYFLQLVCYTLVNRANKEGVGYVTISDVNATLDEMLRLGEVHFAYLWQRSTYPEKALLASVASMMDYDSILRPSDLDDVLKKYSIHLDPAEITAGLNRLVEREIMREIDIEGTMLYELRIGLVGLWVAQNKSFSRLYETNEVIELPKII